MFDVRAFGHSGNSLVNLSVTVPQTLSLAVYL
jgi:hypothetical protein